MSRFIVAAVLAGLVWPVETHAEPLPPPTPLPPPPVAVMPGTVIVAPPMPYRPSRYQVWSYYGVSWSGQFLPLVLDTPHGAYWAATGRPYPGVPNRTLHYMPYARE